MKVSILIALLLLISVLNVNASTYDSFQCPNRSLVHVGQKLSEVI